MITTSSRVLNVSSATSSLGITFTVSCTLNTLSLMYNTYHVTGQNNYTVYNIQARTKGEARRKFKEETGKPPMKVVEA